MRGAACGLGARRWGMRGIMASLTMVLRDLGQRWVLPGQPPPRPSQPSVRSRPRRRGRRTKPAAPARRRITTGLGPRRKQASRAASRSQALSANTSLSHGQSRFSRRSRSPAASASWMSAAGTRTPSSRPQVPSATCCLRLVTFFAAFQPRDPPFASSSRSKDRSRPRSGSAHGPRWRSITAR